MSTAAAIGGLRLTTIAKNALAVVLLGGLWLAVETGYFSSDRTTRDDWTELERRKSSGKGRVVHQASFDRDQLAPGERGAPAGYWDFYNGATADTASVADGALEVRYTSAWIGAYFDYRAFEPKGFYRVRFEARVEEQPGAILVRNRLLDLTREPVPLTGGEFKEFTLDFVAPGGSLDQVRIIFMPDGRGEVKGRMTIRKFLIERLEG